MGGPQAGEILTDDAFDNAITCVLAMGGSTNALVHLIAMARRAGCSLDLDRFDELARATPLIANIRPAGKYLMEDFYYAGGLRALLERIRGRLRTDALTVNGAHAGREHRGRARVQRRRDPARWTSRSCAKEASPCCAATWRPMAP